MVATVSTRGVLKPSQNRVRTRYDKAVGERSCGEEHVHSPPSPQAHARARRHDTPPLSPLLLRSVALQGNAMWENVIGVVNEQAGTNSGVEALIYAPSHGGGRKAAQERRAAAHSAVLATGGFDTAITNYQSLLNLAKSQGAVGGGADRGACRICGHVGHLTRQCRNAVSLTKDDGAEGGASASAAAAPAPADDISDLDLSDSDSEARRERRRKKDKRKHKHSSSSSKSKVRPRDWGRLFVLAERGLQGKGALVPGIERSHFPPAPLPCTEVTPQEVVVVVVEEAQEAAVVFN